MPSRAAHKKHRGSPPGVRGPLVFCPSRAAERLDGTADRNWFPRRDWWRLLDNLALHHRAGKGWRYVGHQDAARQQRDRSRRWLLAQALPKHGLYVLGHLAARGGSLRAQRVVVRGLILGPNEVQSPDRPQRDALVGFGTAPKAGLAFLGVLVFQPVLAVLALPTTSRGCTFGRRACSPPGRVRPAFDRRPRKERGGRFATGSD